jgi:hypothetical protein
MGSIFQHLLGLLLFFVDQPFQGILTVCHHIRMHPKVKIQTISHQNHVSIDWHFQGGIFHDLGDGNGIEKRPEWIVENGKLPFGQFLTNHGRKTGTDRKDWFVVINLTFPLRDIKRSSPKHGIKLERKPANP